MPSFRGEFTDSTHLSQFFHSEVELPVPHSGIVKTAEEYLKALVARFLVDAQEQILSVKGDLSHLENFLKKDSFPVVTMAGAMALLGKKEEYFTFPTGNFASITRAGEKKLIRHFEGPVWLTGFNHALVPFYQAFDPENGELALASDLLLGPGEILGCGQRHTTALELSKAWRCMALKQIHMNGTSR